MASTKSLTRQEMENFLYHEARLLDEGRLDEWFALFTEDAHYWVPQSKDDLDPTREVSIIYDDHNRLAARMYRHQQTPVHGQIPPSRTRHFVTNVEVADEPDSEETVGYANFIIYELRRNEQRSFAGSYEYRLRRQGDGWRIVLKKANLINSDSPLYNLTFLI